VEGILKRNDYLDFLLNWKDRHVIKVVSGVRRSGKSMLLEVFQEELRQSGIDNSQIISINFETRAARALRDAESLEDYIFEKLDLSIQNYVFLDEIQQVSDFERVVDSLYVEKNIDVYITGSNAYFLSGEFATLLTGRYVELKILPLSFSEYVTWNQENRPETIYWTLPMYFENFTKSSFPFTLSLKKDDDIRTYLEGIYATVMIKDIVSRKSIADTGSLERVVEFLFSVIGAPISVNKIKNTLASNGFSLSPLTVDKYLSGLQEALLFYPCRRYNVRGRQLLAREEKYYAVDVGLRQVLLPDAQPDSGHVLENIIFLELLRRKKQVFVGKFDAFEIDFVTIDEEDNMEFFQVALSTLDENTLERELRPLQKMNNSYPKYLLTLDEIDKNKNYNGIMKRNALEWLMHNK
jgi:predicted AAA+ superfamily ATPase